jgi:hypothetical protein
LIPWVLSAGNADVQNSVLATGKWYKFSVRNSGMHRITYYDLMKMGISPGTVNPTHIRIFSNGSGMVPESNAPSRIDDLREISIVVKDGGDGRFDPQDCILFYGEGPDTWVMNRTTHIFSHSKNLYSDVTYYYMTFDLGEGKRVKLMPRFDTAANSFSSRYDDFTVHEQDLVNVIKSGKQWYGEMFSKAQPRYDFNYSFPYIDSISPIRIKTNVIGRSDLPSEFYIYKNGIIYDSISIDPVALDDASGNFAEGKARVGLILYPKQQFQISIEYNAPDDASTGWLDYIEMQLSRNLYWSAPEFVFRDVNSIGPGKITQFTMKNAKPDLYIWDISDMSNISQIQTTFSGTSLKFSLRTDSLHTFLAFDGTHYDTVKFESLVSNQNLHALQPKEMIIVAPTSLLSEARRLADFHKNHNQIDALVVSVQEIYNEFSCGQPDPGGIRDFVKMLYDRGQSSVLPNYLLLFGDGSYDPKNRVPGNNNLIPAFESQESLSYTASFVTDDFYGIMGDTEGYDGSGSIEIGVGRFPVSTPEQAEIVVDKIIHYSSSNDTILSDWNNLIAFAADDGNSNYFFKNSEDLAVIVANKYPFLNVNKIYFDAYPIVIISSGTRYPEANKAINSAVARGTMIINYIGHGGESGWSTNQCLTIPDIESWTNSEKLPVFVTATCEFSRFDNPARFSAGEQIFTMAGGGGIALFSTSRTTYAGTNQSLDTSFFRHLMDKKDGKYIKMGELIKISKNINQNNSLLRNFVLLGDPAQQITFPELQVITTEINGHPANQTDTALGLSRVSVSGQIEDSQGNPVNSFQGVLTATIFDKPTVYYTLGNTQNSYDGSYPAKFTLQDHVLNRLKVPVTDGSFTFSFLVPEGVALNFGKGKISYYAENGQTDANGYYDNLILGGRDPQIIPGTRGPDIAMYMDNRSFISGGRTSPDPLLIADLHDTSGINAFSLGIGHDILGVLDDDWAQAIQLNDYYDPAVGDYSRGSVNYQFSGLSTGVHKLTLRAWDLVDNSSQKDLLFWVFNPSSINIQDVFCFPNPAFDHTTFSFNPVNNGGGVYVIIEITNLSGIRVKTITASFPEYTQVPLLIQWDLKDEGGNKLSSGLYPFVIKFKANNGAYSQASGKVVIIR